MRRLLKSLMMMKTVNVSRIQVTFILPTTTCKYVCKHWNQILTFSQFSSFAALKLTYVVISPMRRKNMFIKNEASFEMNSLKSCKISKGTITAYPSKTDSSLQEIFYRIRKKF